MDMDNLFNNSLPQSQKVDGGYAYEFNLAGFSEDEITLRLDPKANVLHVSAKGKGEFGSREASYAMGLLNEGKIEASNVSTDYRNGLLVVTVKDDAASSSAFEIPLKKNTAAIEDTGSDGPSSE